MSLARTELIGAKGGASGKTQAAPPALFEHHGGSFGVYMHHKKAKLDLQFDGSYAEERASNIFAGVRIYVNGHVQPPFEQLKLMVGLNGGVVDNYLTSAITHVVASNLPDSKVKQIRALRKGMRVPVVYPAWVVDSCAAGATLPTHGYVLPSFKEAGMMPLGVPAAPLARLEAGGAAFSAEAAGDGHGNFSERPGASLASSSSASSAIGPQMASQVRSASMLAVPPPAAKRPRLDSAAAATTAAGSSRDVSPDHGDATAAATSAAPSAAAGSSIADRFGWASSSSRASGGASTSDDASSDAALGAPANGKQPRPGGGKSWGEERVLPSRSAGADPLFLEGYLSSSRLHFIGSFRSHVQTLVALAQHGGSGQGGRPLLSLDDIRPVPGSPAALAVAAGRPLSDVLSAPAAAAAGTSSRSGSVSGRSSGGSEGPRIIAHIDLDCFFAQVALLTRPHLRHRPVVVAHIGARPGAVGLANRGTFGDGLDTATSAAAPIQAATGVTGACGPGGERGSVGDAAAVGPGDGGPCPDSGYVDPAAVGAGAWQHPAAGRASGMVIAGFSDGSAAGAGAGRAPSAAAATLAAGGGSNSSHAVRMPIGAGLSRIAAKMPYATLLAHNSVSSSTVPASAESLRGGSSGSSRSHSSNWSAAREGSVGSDPPPLASGAGEADDGVEVAAQLAADPSYNGGEVSSANYAARAFGVCAGMSVREAAKLCPGLIAVPYDFPRITAVSETVFKLFLRLTRRVQAVSCDEAYLDISGHPAPLRALQQLRADALALTGCTVSVGVGPNMLLARLATAKAKPDGMFVLPDEPAVIAGFLAPLAVDKIPGVGYQKERVLESAGIRTVADLQQVPQATLAIWFGDKTAEALHSHATGVDARPVTVLKPRQSIGCECNWGIRFTSSSQAHAFLRRLCAEVSTRMAAAAAEDAAVAGIRFDDAEWDAGSTGSSGAVGAGAGVSHAAVAPSPAAGSSTTAAGAGAASSAVNPTQAHGPQPARVPTAYAIRGRAVTFKIMIRRPDAGAPFKHMGHGLCDDYSRSATFARPTCDADTICAAVLRLYDGFNVDPTQVRGLGVQITKLVHPLLDEVAAAAMDARGRGDGAAGAAEAGGQRGIKQFLTTEAAQTSAGSSASVSAPLLASKPVAGVKEGKRQGGQSLLESFAGLRGGVGANTASSKAGAAVPLRPTDGAAATAYSGSNSGRDRHDDDEIVVVASPDGIEATSPGTGCDDQSGHRAQKPAEPAEQASAVDCDEDDAFEREPEQADSFGLVSDEDGDEGGARGSAQLHAEMFDNDYEGGDGFTDGGGEGDDPEGRSWPAGGQLPEHWTMRGGAYPSGRAAALVPSSHDGGAGPGRRSRVAVGLSAVGPALLDASLHMSQLPPAIDLAALAAIPAAQRASMLQAHLLRGSGVGVGSRRGGTDCGAPVAVTASARGHATGAVAAGKKTVASDEEELGLGGEVGGAGGADSEEVLEGEGAEDGEVLIVDDCDEPGPANAAEKAMRAIDGAARTTAPRPAGSSFRASGSASRDYGGASQLRLLSNGVRLAKGQRSLVDYSQSRSSARPQSTTAAAGKSSASASSSSQAWQDDGLPAAGGGECAGESRSHSGFGSRGSDHAGVYHDASEVVGPTSFAGLFSRVAPRGARDIDLKPDPGAIQESATAADPKLGLPRSREPEDAVVELSECESEDDAAPLDGGGVAAGATRGLSHAASARAHAISSADNSVLELLGTAEGAASATSPLPELGSLVLGRADTLESILATPGLVPCFADEPWQELGPVLKAWMQGVGPHPAPAHAMLLAAYCTDAVKRGQLEPVTCILRLLRRQAAVLDAAGAAADSTPGGHEPQSSARWADVLVHVRGVASAAAMRWLGVALAGAL